jgi:hypothetical protein
MARVAILLCIPLLLCGCEPVAIAMLGAGASAALRYNLDGVAARTFTAPVAAVKNATLAALQRMGISLDGTGSYDSGELLYGRAENRDIELELEPITKQATRLRVTARGGSLLYDNATAVELVQQTGKILDEQTSVKLLPPEPPSAAAGGSATPRLTAN